MNELAYSTGAARGSAARWGVAVAILVAAANVYGVYGDSKAPASQRDSLPVVIAIGMVVTAVVFGLLVPAGLRAIEQRSSSAPKWALGHAIVAVLSIVLFWSGLPLILGSAAALIGTHGLRLDTTNKQMAIARGLGVFAAVASIAVLVLGNVLHN